MKNWIIAPIEYALLIAGTVYGLQWAANIVLLLIWVKCIVVVPLLGLLLVLTICLRAFSEGKLPDWSKAVEKLKPDGWEKFWRVMCAFEIALMAAYGWMTTAAFTSAALIASIMLRGAIVEFAKPETKPAQ